MPSKISSDHWCFCWRIRTTRSVRQSKKEMFSEWEMRYCANILLDQARMFFFSTSSCLLRYFILSFSDTSNSYLSFYRPW